MERMAKAFFAHIQCNIVQQKFSIFKNMQSTVDWFLIPPLSRLLMHFSTKQKITQYLRSFFFCSFAGEKEYSTISHGCAITFALN